MAEARVIARTEGSPPSQLTTIQVTGSEELVHIAESLSEDGITFYCPYFIPSISPTRTNGWGNYWLNLYHNGDTFSVEQFERGRSIGVIASSSDFGLVRDYFLCEVRAIAADYFRQGPWVGLRNYPSPTDGMSADELDFYLRRLGQR